MARKSRAGAGPAGTPKGQGKNPRQADPRHCAADALEAVLLRGERLDNALQRGQSQLPEARDRALFRELASGVVRWYPRLAALRTRLLDKPLKEPRLDMPILLGLYQILHMRIPPHAAVSTSVDLAQQRGFTWARGLVNAVLRRFLRERDAICAAVDADDAMRHAYPRWLVDELTRAWPDDAEQILARGNERAPLTIRVNPATGSRDDYLKELVELGFEASACAYASFGIEIVSAGDPRALPGFDDGRVSVQDAAAQLTAEILVPAAGARVLDACAAPGGKTAALLERYAGIDMTAIDIAEPRVDLIHSSLDRLGLSAQVSTVDATMPEAWWDGQPFDHILVDAPCSATGIIRRHPDIKLRRDDADGANNAMHQRALLQALWPLLGGGGTLLYATCSILPTENAEVIEHFISENAHAEVVPINAYWGRTAGPGRQILTGESGMDGFFYALLRKP
jgi:16S rRNA (cytosine967-C5)-methyltransferase